MTMSRAQVIPVAHRGLVGTSHMVLLVYLFSKLTADAILISVWSQAHVLFWKFHFGQNEPSNLVPSRGRSGFEIIKRLLDKYHTYRHWRNRRKPRIEIMKPKCFFFMVNMASGLARGRVLSSTKTTTVSHQCGAFSHASLVNIRSHKGSHQLNDIGYSCQLTAVKTRNPLTSVTWPYRWLRLVSEDVY